MAMAMSTTERCAEGGGILESRAYQIEMFEHAMRENTIVAMETGSGKTQIAKLCIEVELERSPHKRVWFCAPSVVLAQQQHVFLSAQLPAHQTRLITGLDNARFWSTQAIWDAALDGMALIVSTPQILLDALSHGFFALQQLSLLVFDEAHHCIANGPMALIMHRFYHPLRKTSQAASLPRILGLTASPMTNKPSMVYKLEDNMHSVCRTPTLQIENYKQHVFLPSLERVSFHLWFIEPSMLLKTLNSAVTKLSVHNDPTVAWLRSREQTSLSAQQKLSKILAGGRTPIMKQMRSFLGHAYNICNDIGPWAADLYVRSCASKLHEAVLLHEPLIPDLAEQEQRYVDTQLQSVLALVPTSTDDIPSQDLIAAKTKAVIDYLLREYHEGITAIIFVKRRSVAFALTQLLQSEPRMVDYEVISFVGQANPAGRQLVDLSDMKLQNEAFADFQSGKRNICVATQVMEEGVDIQATNLVIRFDEPETFRSFIQSRGRARRPDSKFVMVHPIEGGEAFRKLDHWRDLENMMKEQYSDQSRTMSDRVAIEQEREQGNEFYRVDGTGAVLSYDNARQHLEHFCATLPYENASEPARPVTIIHGDPFGPKSAQVVLPSSVAPALQVTNSLRSWRTEKMAKMDAAFQAYKRLHIAGLVSDNLLPHPRERPDKERLEGRDSTYEVHGAVNTWTILAGQFPESAYVQTHRVKIRGQDFASPDMLLLLPVQLDHSLSLTLHSVASGTISVEIIPEGRLPTVLTDLARQITIYLFKIVLGRRLKRFSAADQLPYFIMPDASLSDPAAWLARSQHATPLSHLVFNDSLQQDVYLVKHEHQEILYRWQPSFNGQSIMKYDANDTIVAERLSKQLSFFKDNQSDQDGSPPVKRSLGVCDCTIQGLPAAYSSFMLLMPSISHALGVALRGQLAVQRGPLTPITFSNSALVTEALTSSSASSEKNFESLEFIGDSLLKYYASAQVYFDYPDLTEGGLNAKCQAIVSNARLQRATRELGLDAYITVEPFSGQRWTLAPPKDVQSKRQMSSKTLADVIEAIIGAAYLDTSNGPTQDELPMLALSHIFPGIHWKSPATHIQHFLQSSNSSRVQVARLDNVEDILGYHFRHKSMLDEALTRASLRIGARSFQRLEYLGDAILDRIVNIALYKSGFGLDPEHLKGRRDALVNQWLLAFLAMRAHCTVITNDIHTTESGQTKVGQKSTIVRLIDHMRTLSDRAELRQRQEAESTFLQAHAEISNALDTGRTFPWVALHGIDTSKSYSDLIESILAAVFIDSHGSLSTCEQVLEKLGFLPILRRMTSEPDLDVRQPIVALRLKHPDMTMEEHDTGKLRDETKKFSRAIRLDGEIVASADSDISGKHAEACAAVLALTTLENGR